MNKLVALSSAALALCLYAAPANAQATRTWVSGVGDDMNPCSRTAPCKTFAGAISKTAVNGEINCLDPGGYGAVTITKSIMIDCHYTHGSILHSATTGVSILFDNFVSVGEARKTVRLRGLSLNASGGASAASEGLRGVRITGGAGAAGSEVFIEETVIDGNGVNPANGIRDERTGGGKLYVKNTTVRNNGGAGIIVVGSATRMDVSIDNVSSQNNSAGLAINNNTKAMVTRSVFSGNVAQGIDSEGAGAETSVDFSVISNNGTGVTTFSGGVLRVSNSSIAYNTTAATNAWISFGNNQVMGNTNAGTAPTAAGGPTNNLGQQ